MNFLSYIIAFVVGFLVFSNQIVFDRLKIQSNHYQNNEAKTTAYP